MPSYSVHIVRTEIRSATFTVTASNEREAEDRALIEASDDAFSSGPSAEYEVESVTLEAALNPVLQTPKVTAETHDDECRVEVSFDCTLWFAQADDAEITSLMECQFGGDYPADEVARYYEGRNPEVRAMFAVTGDGNGFECHVKEEEALAWITAHRPHLLQAAS